jgi:Asp-tRNA(Asn)/Glu-tRNA(Gln) amidotransferase A subunit family amidase
MVPVAIGSQTMGSLIRPAAYCGIVGFKPTFGLINRTGMKPQAETFDHVGVMARTVDDVSIVSAVLSTSQMGGWEEDFDGAPHIGVYRGPDWSKAEQSAIDVFDLAIRRLSDAGATLDEVVGAQELLDAYDAQITLLAFEMARGLSWEWQNHRDSISPLLREWITRGWSVSVAEYWAAQQRAEEGRRYIASALSDVDVWLTLSAPGEAPFGLQNTGDTVFNRLWSLLHVPALTLPVARGPTGLPLGVQFVARPRGDMRLISVGRWAEDALR